MSDQDELFVDEAWSRVITDTYGFDLRRVNGIPCCFLDDLAGRRISALPFSDYLPIDEQGDCTQLLEALKDYSDFAITIKTRLSAEDCPAPFTVSKRAVYHRYFPGTKASSSFRRGTKQAIRAGTRVQRSSDDAARERFEELYHQQRLRKFGGIPQPPSFFRSIQKHFMDAGRGFYLEAFTHDDRHAATLVVLRSGAGWFYKFGTSNPNLLNDRPNNLLFTHLTEAVDAGEADFLDLGLSGSSDDYAGLRRFKSSIGALEKPLTYLTYLPPGYSAEAEKQFKSSIGAVTDALVAADAGRATVAPFSETLYRYFA